MKKFLHTYSLTINTQCRLYWLHFRLHSLNKLKKIRVGQIHGWPTRSKFWVGHGPHGPPGSGAYDSDRPTQRRASSDDKITVSATGVLRLLDHVCGTCCRFIYGCVTVLNSLNGCSRPICLVFGTAALCDALVRSAVYK